MPRSTAPLRLVGLCAGLTGVNALRSFVEQQEDVALVDQVNILAGTSNVEGGFSQGNTLPIIARPWGFNHWAVQTRGSGSNWWFDPSDTAFFGLRCTHQPSPWIGDYGHFLVSPAFEPSQAGPLQYDPGAATFRPYFFKATLNGAESPRLDFQAVPTMHGAAFLITLPSYRDGALNLRLPVGNWTLRGNSSRVVGGGRADGDHEETLFVAAESDDRTASWSCEGRTASLVFAKGATSVIVRLATSFISAQQAELNLHRELGGKPFRVLKAEAKAEWEKLLARAEVEFHEPARSAVFYSNLYRGMLFPRFLSELNKEGHAVHRSPFTKQVVAGHAVTDEGFWDAYRTHYPMLSLLFPDILGKIVDGWVSAYRERGWLPAWASYNQRHSMVGTMGDCSLADAVVKSSQGLISGFDKAMAFHAIYKDATIEPDEFDLEAQFGRVALKEYEAKGYVPSDYPSLRRFAGEQSAALTLNYNLADACIARAAKALGYAKTAERLEQRSKSFRTLFDNQTKYFRPRRMNGHWDHELNPIAWGDGFTEAAAAQYRFDAPQDVPDLVTLMGGKTEFCEKIRDMFHSSPDFDVGSYGQVIHEMEEARAIGSEFGLGLYAHNNQPVHHVLYVAIAGGCGSFAQRMLRKVMDRLYTKDGWSGDEDTGEMSSWYVLSALGIYSLVPGSDALVLGSPEVSSARLRVPGRPALLIQAPGNNAETVYVTGASLNQQRLGSVVEYSRLAREGGQLTFEMSTTPS